jgi:uncharacterized protein YndB with AHSA1/START domain
MPGTVTLHRVLAAPAERVYRAFTHPRALERWLPPYGFVGEITEFDAQVGGGYSMSFTNFTTMHAHSFRCTFTEMVDHERLAYTDTFDDPNMPGDMEVTVTLRPVSCGTDLVVIQSGIPDMIPLEMCELGWQESLDQLSRLVTADLSG